jgi:hypothetical protein
MIVNKKRAQSLFAARPNLAKTVPRNEIRSAVVFATAKTYPFINAPDQ